MPYINSLNEQTLQLYDNGTVAASSSKTITLNAAVSYLVITTGGSSNRMSMCIAYGRNNNAAIIQSVVAGGQSTIEESGTGIKITNSNTSYGINYFVVKL